jgi:glycosyltransferase involved in cell wall biosynthesis
MVMTDTGSDLAPLVSVVVPTYNRASLLPRALSSVLAQSLGDLELIVVDDGSTDSTGEVVRSFRDRRIRLIRLPTNRGQGEAANAGVRAARGEWVAFLDSDDEWLPTKLERQIARLREYQGSAGTVAYCCLERRDERTGRSVPAPRGGPEGDVFRALLTGWSPLPSCLVVGRRALLAIGGWDETLPTCTGHDLCLRLAEAGSRFVAVRETLVIKHDFGGPQASTAYEAALRGFERLDQTWAARLRARFGPGPYRRWRARWRTGTEYIGVRSALWNGDRRAAWRHALRLAWLAPWSAGYVVRGLAMAALGFRIYSLLASFKDSGVSLLGFADMRDTLRHRRGSAGTGRSGDS